MPSSKGHTEPRSWSSTPSAAVPRGMATSVCCCAGGKPRPVAAKAIQHDTRPDTLTTVFAGQDVDAVQRARSYFTGYAPSSPQIGLLKDGKIVVMLERHQIEGRTSDDIAQDLIGAFDKYCEKTAAA